VDVPKLIERSVLLLDIPEDQYALLLREVRIVYGYSFEHYSKASMYRRISRFLIAKNIETMEELRKRISSDKAFFDLFLSELTVNVTEMFRDPSFFKALRTKVFPFLKTYPSLRIWDAGCSTGEETYSLAISLKEESYLHKSRIYATDINYKVLDVAKEGLYPLTYMKDYSRNYLSAGGKGSLSDYYHAKYNSAIFDQELRKNFVFSVHNLAMDSSFNEFNLIVCRNVLIYFQKQLQEKVLELFKESLPIYGYLALGSKESIRFSAIEKCFEVVDAHEKIFRRIR
jgi:chemotaxis protein methyltransferase CheR